MKNLLFVVFLICVLYGLSGCESQMSPTLSLEDEQIPSEEQEVQILFGMGNEIGMARETPLFQNAPVHMISSWFSKPEDLEWLRYYPERNTLSTLYGQGYAQELIIWLDEYPQYAISDQFQEDLAELIEIFKGNGPEQGPLYVVLFTEYETYSDDPAYFKQLRDAFLESKKTIKQVYGGAQVAIGMGCYEWFEEERELKDWEKEVLQASDFVAVQGHHHISNVDLLMAQIHRAVDQLSTYGKPIMLSHFRLWKKPEEEARRLDEAFLRFIKEMHNEETMKALADKGLFAWNFFWDDFINKQRASYHAIEKVVKAYGAKPAPLPDSTAEE